MSSNLQFITSAVGFNVNTLDIDDCFSAKYDIYFCTMDKVHHRTDANSPVYLRYKYSGGLDTTSSYQHAGDFQKAYASGGDQQSTGSTFHTVSYANSQEAYQTGTRFYVYRPFDSNRYTFISGEFQHYYNVNGLEYFRRIHVHVVNQQNTGFRLQFTGSEVGDLNINVYGVK